MTTSHSWLYWLEDGTDLFSFEAQVRERIGARRAELESKYLAARFTRILDAYLFDASFPEDEVEVDSSQPVHSLVTAAYLSILTQHTDLELLNSTSSSDYDPFGFEMRIGRDPDSEQTVVEVTCKNAQLIREFDQFIEVSPVADETTASMSIGLHVPNDFERRVIERTFDENPLVSVGWHFELSAQTAPSIATTTQESVIASSASVNVRARALAPLLISIASRELLLQTPPSQLPAMIARTSGADPSLVIRMLQRSLPPLSADLLHLPLQELYDSIPDKSRAAIQEELAASLQRVSAPPV